MKVIGIQRIDYTNKNGYHVLGYKLYTVTPFNEFKSGCIGEYAEEVFVSDKAFDQCDNISIGAEISIAYNKFGKVVAISVIG